MSDVFLKFTQGIIQIRYDYFDWFYDEVEDVNHIFIMKQKKMLEILTKENEDHRHKVVQYEGRIER